jgi:hypothetical protein
MARPSERPDLDRIEVASRDEITALQLARLKAILRHAYASPITARRSIGPAWSRTTCAT